MEVENVKKYIGKRVLIVLKNDFQYTAVIPNLKSSSFEIIDKFNNKISIDCEYIAFIEEKITKNNDN